MTHRTLDSNRQQNSNCVQGHNIFFRFYRNKETEYAREQDRDRRLVILGDIRDLKERQLQFIRIENEQAERERQNLRAALECHHQLSNK